MSEQTAEAPEIVERDDSNNANLLTFEVTWENGTVEHVKAHWVRHPSQSMTGQQGEHIKFVGWYDGVHRTALTARPDRIRCIRDLGVMPSQPDVDPDPLGDLLAECSVQMASPGQVDPEPAAAVRLDSLRPRIADGEVIAISHPDWNDGKPVDLVELHARFAGDMEVRYGVRGVFALINATVPADFLVTPA